MITKEQEAALNELECDTHTLWPPEAAKRLTAPFGFEARVSHHVADASPWNPKGLTLSAGKTEAEGASSWSISGQIASHYKLRPPGKLGRGFQVRSDCDAIREHLNKEQG